MWPKHVACVALSIKHDIYDDGRRHRQSTPLRSTMCVQVPSLVSHISPHSQLPMSCAKVGGSYSATLEHRGSTSLCTSPLTVYSSLTTDCVQFTHHWPCTVLYTDCTVHSPLTGIIATRSSLAKSNYWSAKSGFFNTRPFKLRDTHTGGQEPKVPYGRLRLPKKCVAKFGITENSNISMCHLWN